VLVRTVAVRTVVVHIVVVHTVVVVVVEVVVVGIAVPKAFDDHPISRTAPVETILSASMVSSGGDVCVFKEIIRFNKI